MKESPLANKRQPTAGAQHAPLEAPSPDVSSPASARSAAATPLTTEERAAQEAAASNLLSPAEQMARFEQELKENDWGHQPC